MAQNLRLTTKQIKLLSNLYNDYQSIESDKDLRKRKLTLNDYHTVPTVFTDIQAEGKAETFIESVAKYFRQFGFNVVQKAVNFEISI